MACGPNYQEIARLLQGRLRDLTAGDSSTKWRELLEMAAEEFGVQRDEFVQSRKRSKKLWREEAASGERDVREEQSCQHSCCEHTELMDPNRYGSLPDSLLQLVFANLPANKILDLQYLSKEWKETMGARGHSDFLRACDEAHPKMFALVRELNEPGNGFLVRVFDTKSNTWLALRTCSGLRIAELGVPNPRGRFGDSMRCEDGGLVLFSIEADWSPRGEDTYWSLFCTVMNPLTRHGHDLPPIVDVQNVCMHHMMVDRATSCYKVLVVVNRGGTDDTQVYDSETGEWCQPNEAKDVMFGSLSAHDFAKGRLIEQDGGVRSLWDKEGVQSHSFLKNRLFVLLKDSVGHASDLRTDRPRTMYYIREYVVEYHPQHAPTWLDVGMHKCVPFECPPRCNYKMMLRSTNGFLMVFAGLYDFRKAWENSIGWLYDMSTRTWRDLPKLPGNMCVWMNSDTTCEIRWNAHL